MRQSQALSQSGVENSFTLCGAKILVTGLACDDDIHNLCPEIRMSPITEKLVEFLVIVVEIIFEFLLDIYHKLGTFRARFVHQHAAIVFTRAYRLAGG